ncbi:MAG TPA: Tad domain-containing protein [Candidatus Dormibacteraeota bacterium]|nr:Tad domain-containing protein [Candidatus Dormibacteraeota bacterium]
MLIKLRRMGGQRGQVLVIFGLSAVALFAVVALAIDGGRMLMDQRALQNATDGAALLAASDIGPGADTTQDGWAEDDASLSIERSLSISFSNNYSGVAHRLIGGAGSCANACSPPWSPTACCTNWVDTSGGYVLTIQTPHAFGSAEAEAVVWVKLVHHMSLMIGGNLWPTIDVTAMTTARNYAIPYAIFVFKHNDQNALSSNNNNTSLAANKRIGSNGSAFKGSMNFTCVVPPSGGATRWGGDFYSYHAVSTGPTITGTKENTCPAPGTAAGNVALTGTFSSGPYVLPPTIHLPDDPCLLTPNPCGANQAVQGALTVSSTQMLTPTIPADPSQPLGPRYSTVNVSSGSTLYLQPGVYFFEGTTANSGLQITSGGTVVTGDCYAPITPSFPNCSSTALCTTATTISPLVGTMPNIFKCGPGNDMGVLLVFWPHGTDVACTPATFPTASFPYCTQQSTTGSDNQLHIQGTANLYITSSPRYHSVVLFVNPAHASSSWNFTTQASLPAGFTTAADAAQLGNGSNVIYVQGGGSISVVGATFAPQDNIYLGGASGGKGYGQLLTYFIWYQGNAAINESYNPMALVYAPVIVQ